MSINDLKNKASEGINRAKELSGKVKDSSQATGDRVKIATQPYLDKAKSNPQVEKVLDGASTLSGTLSGKRLEDKLAEYTTVYGDVLLSLYERLEEQQQFFKEQQQLSEARHQEMKKEINSLRAEIRTLRSK